MKFKDSHWSIFIGIIKKYAKVRKSLSMMGSLKVRKFYNYRKTDITPNSVADIITLLGIPLHEIIDCVEEEYADHFVKIVRQNR